MAEKILFQLVRPTTFQSVEWAQHSSTFRRGTFTPPADFFKRKVARLEVRGVLIRSLDAPKSLWSRNSSSDPQSVLRIGPKIEPGPWTQAVGPGPVRFFSGPARGREGLSRPWAARFFLYQKKILECFLNAVYFS